MVVRVRGVRSALSGSRLRYLVRVADMVLGGQLLSLLVCYVMWVNTTSILPHVLRVKNTLYMDTKILPEVFISNFSQAKKIFFFSNELFLKKIFFCVEKIFLACKWVNLKIHKHVSFPP